MLFKDDYAFELSGEFIEFLEPFDFSSDMFAFLVGYMQ